MIRTDTHLQKATGRYTFRFLICLCDYSKTLTKASRLTTTRAAVDDDVSWWELIKTISDPDTLAAEDL